MFRPTRGSEVLDEVFNLEGQLAAAAGVVHADAAPSTTSLSQYKTLPND
jgi:hypothetical protein